MVSSGHFNTVTDYAGPLIYFVGDQLPVLLFEFLYDGGGPVVLTDTTIDVSVARLKGNTAVKTGTASITDDINGLATFSWGGFSFNSPGIYVGQAKITFSSGFPLGTQKFLIEVQEKVAGL